MERPTSHRSDGKRVDNTAEGDGFVNIDLSSFEKDIEVCEAAGQEQESKPVEGMKTRLVILILILLLLGTASLIVALFVHLARKQKI
jgi:hypothetical protein